MPIRIKSPADRKAIGRQSVTRSPQIAPIGHLGDTPHSIGRATFKVAAKDRWIGR
jgi:hypothetical protein